MRRGVLDTSVIINIFDRGNERLLEYILRRYKMIYIPWIVLYEYLYGHKYLGRDISERKSAIEKLGIIYNVSQEVLLKALEIDVSLRKKGNIIPFSDVIIAATTIVLKAELVTLDKRHYERIAGLKLHIVK